MRLRQRYNIMFPQSVRARVVFYTRRCNLVLTRSKKKWRMDNRKDGTRGARARKQEKTAKRANAYLQIHANTANLYAPSAYDDVRRKIPCRFA